MSGLNKIFEEMLRPNRVGLQKSEKHGEDFLSIIAK